MRKAELKSRVGEEFAAVRRETDSVHQDPYDWSGQFIRVKLVEVDAPIMKHRSWGQGTYDSGHKGYKVEALEDSGSESWNKVSKGDQYVIAARQIIDSWDTFTAKVEAREKAKVEAREQRKAAVADAKARAKSLNERLRNAGLGDILSVTGDDRGNTYVNRLLESHVERLLDTVERTMLSEEEQEAVVEALSYYDSSDFGHGGVAPENRPEGAEEHRAAIKNAMAKLVGEEVTR